MSIYIHLWNGREDPNSQSPDGEAGPHEVLVGPMMGIHTAYKGPPRLCPPNKQLMRYDDMLFFDGKFYGDWSVITEVAATTAPYYKGVTHYNPGLDEEEFDKWTMLPDPMPDPWVPEMNTHIEYMYRDGDNYKGTEEVVVAGRLTWEEIEPLLDNADKHFIPFNVGLLGGQETYRYNYEFPNDADHVYNEMYEDGSSITPTKRVPTIPMTARQLLDKFKEQHEKGWPIEEAMKHYGLFI